MTDSTGLLEKSNMMILSKELNEKDSTLKSQLLIATKNDEKSPIKNIKSDFNIHKKYFLENTLVYINQACLSIKKKPLIYNNYFILGQIIPLQNLPQYLDNYICEESETKMLVPLCGTIEYSNKTICCKICQFEYSFSIDDIIMK